MHHGPPLDPKQMTIEPPPQPRPRNLPGATLGVSQSQKQFKPMTGTTAGLVTEGEETTGTDEPLKYSESMQTLRVLKSREEANIDRPPSSMFKKGTADFIKRKIVDKESQSADYNTNDHQKSLEDRFKTDVLGDSSDRTFLPIESFDPLLDIEVPREAIEKYKDPATGETIGLTKWNFPNGDAELRRCLV
jgi:hypothetical protein